MATSNAPEEADSRTSSVGRKRGSQQASQNPSTANSSTSESSSASSRKQQRSARRRGRNREVKQERKKREREEDEENEEPSNSEKKQKLEGTAQNAPQAAEPGASNGVSWNKGVQPTLRTSFGKKPAGTLKPAAVETNAEGEALVTQLQDKADDNHENSDASAWAKKLKKEREEKKAKKLQAKNESKAPKSPKEYAQPKPTQKLNVGGEGQEIWVKYSLEHRPRAPNDNKEAKTKSWVRGEIQNRFVPYLTTYNTDIVGKLDEDKILEVVNAFVNQQPLYDDSARDLALKFIQEAAFRGYCRNQLRKAKIAQQNSQNSPGEPLASENPFGKLLASTDVSNAVSDIDEKEFGEDGGEDMDISMVESNDSGEIADDASEASDFPKWKTRSTGDRSGRSPSFEPHPVDAAIGSRLNNTTEGTKPEIEVVDMTTPKKPKNSPPIPGLPQQVSIALAEVQKYYPDIRARDQPHCLTCNKPGHIAAFCPELTCDTCGERGLHFTYACPQNIICPKCREKGHKVEDCKEKLARSVADGVVCEICGSTKHIGDNCHLLWRTYEPEKIQVKKVQRMLVDCYNCGALNHFGTECGLRGSRMPYASQSWTAENRARYLEGAGAVGNSSGSKGGNGFAIRGMASNEPIQISDSEEESFIRPKIAPPPQKQHLKFADRVTMPNAPPQRNNNLPMYAQQPPPPQPNWAAVQGNGAYRAENFADRNGMDYADDFRDNGDYQSFKGRDHDDLYRRSGRQDEPFRAQNNAASRDPFSTRPQPKRARQPNRPSGGGRGRGGGVGARNGRGGGGGGGGRGGRGGRR